MATGPVHISRVDKSSIDWTVLVQVIEADRVKIARDGDLLRSFCRFQFGDFQVWAIQIDAASPPSIALIVFLFLLLTESPEVFPPLVDRVSRSLRLYLTVLLLLLTGFFCRLESITYRMQRCIVTSRILGGCL